VLYADLEMLVNVGGQERGSTPLNRGAV
jgi:hypothetical protein